MNIEEVDMDMRHYRRDKIVIRKETPDHIRQWIIALVKTHDFSYEQIMKSAILCEYVVDQEEIIRV